GFRDLHPTAARTALPACRRHRAGRPHHRPRDRESRERGRNVGADTIAVVLIGNATKLQELVPARPHRGCDREAVDGGRRLRQATCLGFGLCQRTCFFPCLPAGDGKNADRICREGMTHLVIHDGTFRSMTYLRTVDRLDCDRHRLNSRIRFLIISWIRPTAWPTPFFPIFSRRYQNVAAPCFGGASLPLPARTLPNCSNCAGRYCPAAARRPAPRWPAMCS